MKNAYTVSQINSYIKNMFSQDYLLGSVAVKGEVSNLKYHTSGHIYFTLKDSKGSITCVMFAGNRSGLSFRMTDGCQIVVTGAIDIYEKDGKYQLYAKRITADGQGLLYEQFIQLKTKLEEMGMFDPGYKQPLPRYIHTLGVVTSPTGAVVRDIINISKRRNPYIRIIIYPAIVQGENAPESIIKGIYTLAKENVDVMIVGRGGGSLEDLWAFNDERIARAVFDCPVPIISAVGHETDTTIIDFVADRRAPTPSAAAEQAVYDITVLENELKAAENSLKRLLKSNLEMIKYRVLFYQNRLLNLSPLAGIREKRTYALTLEERLQSLMSAQLKTSRYRLLVYAERLKGLSPLLKLNQGYAFVQNEAGQAVTDIGQVKYGESLRINVKNGRIKAIVESMEKHEK
ncbi:MAG: exodeoxyribonuclease VII large subunit [Lachnospiraceae bacterium]|nr:exodeoxyribonuclease VII large subunit [Lachnospiraceae bacterium]